jgi:predicted 3-demethylubiquinone-9 3-methyltransferase (glyoxalase superfamily)
VKQAIFRVGGQTLRCFDSPIAHSFTFTPAVSLFVEMLGEEQVNEAFARLSEGGAILMPLGEYPHSKHFGWLTDTFGVSWQLQATPD